MTRIVHEGAFHRLTIAPLIAGLEQLDAILAKAEAHAAQNNFDPEVLNSARLYPDMFSLVQQLQYALFIAADFAQHFADSPAPKVGYEEASFGDVHKSLKIAMDYLASISPARMDERANRIVPAFFDPGSGLTAETYAARVIMPDFYFHLTIAYAILRHNGVPLGKADFLGKTEMVPMGSTP